MNDNSIILERSFNAPGTVIWKALTDQEEMKKWYFDIADFKAVPGHEFEFVGIGEDGKTEYIHLCQVKEVIAGKKLSYTWRYKAYEGISLLTFELTDDGENTKLKLTHEGLDSFPATLYPAFARKNFVGGWTYFMEEGLPAYLEKQKSA